MIIPLRILLVWVYRVWFDFWFWFDLPSLSSLITGIESFENAPQLILSSMIILTNWLDLPSLSTVNFGSSSFKNTASLMLSSICSSCFLIWSSFVDWVHYRHICFPVINEFIIDKFDYYFFLIGSSFSFYNQCGKSVLLQLTSSLSYQFDSFDILTWPSSTIYLLYIVLCIFQHH